MNEKIVIYMKGNNIQLIEIPKNFDYIAIENDFKKSIIATQKTSNIKTGWISKQEVKEAINKHLLNKTYKVGDVCLATDFNKATEGRTNLLKELGLED